MKDYEQIFKELKAPFPTKEIYWRVATSRLDSWGKFRTSIIAYVTARAIKNRLNKVLGVENWETYHKLYTIQKAKGNYKEIISGDICTLRIRNAIDQPWVTKEDGAGVTNQSAFKGALSGAEKRAGVQFGIGLYLYDFERDDLVVNTNKTAFSFGDDIWYEKEPKDEKDCPPDKRKAWMYSQYQVFKDNNNKNHYFYFKIPEIPDWALPEEERSHNVDAVFMELKSYYTDEDSRSAMIVELLNSYPGGDIYSPRRLVQLNVADIKERLKNKQFNFQV